MRLNQSDKCVLIALSVGVLIAGIVVVLKGFNAVMFALWLFSFMLFAIFVGAKSKYGFGTDGLPLRFLVEQGAKNGLTEKSVYARGMRVSLALAVVIPFLWKWAS